MEGVIGFVTPFAGNFAPKNWAFCQGQIINIASNTALFSILGTTYGGNGTTTFALPDLRGRTIVGVGNGPGLTPYSLGEVTGVETVTLNSLQMPMHAHNVTGKITPQGTDNNAALPSPSAAMYGQQPAGNSVYGVDATTNMLSYPAQITTSVNGSDSPFQTLRPLLGLNYVVCMFGVYPARN